MEKLDPVDNQQMQQLNTVQSRRTITTSMTMKTMTTMKTGDINAGGETQALVD